MGTAAGLIDAGRHELTLGLATTAMRTLESAVREAKAAGDASRRLEAAIWLAEARYRAPGINAHEMTRNLLRVCMAAGVDANPRLLAQAAEKLARLETMSGTCDRALDTALGVAEAVGNSGDIAEHAHLRHETERAMRTALVGSCALGDKRRSTSRLVASLSAETDPAKWWTVHTWRLVDALEVGDRCRADAALRACQRLGEQASDPYIHLLTHTWESMMTLLSGDLALAGEQIAAALESIDGMELNAGGLGAQLAYLAWERGDRDGSVDLLEEAIDAVPDRCDLYRALLADLLAAQGRVAEAEFEIERLAVGSFGHVSRDRDWLPAMVRLSAAVARVGNVDLARQLREILAPLRDRTVVAGGMPYLFLGAVALYTGELAITCGDADGALVDLAVAREMHERLAARPWVTFTRCEEARALLLRGDPGDARRAQGLLNTVEEEATEMGLAAMLGFTRSVRDCPPKPNQLSPTFVSEEDGWWIAFGSRPFHLLDSKGLRGLHHLLSHPGEPVAATAIVTQVLGSRSRGSGKARVNVTRQLRSAIDKVRQYDETLAAHLDLAVITGTECEYRPAGQPLDWEL